MLGALCNSIAWLVLIAAVMRTVESVNPVAPAQKMLRSGYVTDLIYWLTPYFLYGPLAPKPIAAAFSWAATALTGSPAVGFAVLAQQPFWAQALEVFVIGDFLSYWAHRWLHGRSLWRFHAIHHGPVETGLAVDDPQPSRQRRPATLCADGPFAAAGLSRGGDSRARAVSARCTTSSPTPMSTGASDRCATCWSARSCTAGITRRGSAATAISARRWRSGTCCSARSICRARRRRGSASTNGRPTISSARRYGRCSISSAPDPLGAPALAK